MWLFCKSGFFSAVQHKECSNLIHVRARFEGDIECLRKIHGINGTVTYTPGNDYPYRADFSREDWIDIVKAEADAIDYENFKNEVHDGTARDLAYMAVWSAMRRHS